MANTSAIWQQAAHTTYQLASPSCSTRAIQKSLTLNEKYLRVFWKKEDCTVSRKMTERARGLGREKIEETGKGNQMTALRFQIGGDIRHPRPPFGVRWEPFQCFIIVRDKVARLSTDHNLWRERRGEADSNRGPSAYQPNALPLGQTGSQPFVSMMSWCLMSSDVTWHIRDKLWPMPKHGSINLYVHWNQKAR